ncbi:hypothetical protein MmiHf6_12530 [Methanimicrococcus hongohii]|uniref:GLUG domain-containing protein n=1 Tax=Methanimicrococcus hongohii TaxID=3028295 RepID=A0AA96ZSW8_9EURY|nr:heavy-metal-associated domain-containing protein [Methanimicrococcus sp. Hf6]WNY23929.1 hypothetical protein MmiHf6_12530 [Methanimicrococcus sp. Hf6]
MTFDRYLIDNGEQVIKDATNTSWPYPYVNSKVIEKGNNEAQMFFLSMPETDEMAEYTKIAEDEGITWAHEYTVPENSYTSEVTGMFNQMESGGHYPSGFSFTIETETPTNGLSPAIGFNAFFEFTPENLGEDRYNGLAAILQTQDSYGTWALPEADVLTGLGVHIYQMNGSMPEDITEGVSFGIDTTDADDGLLLLSYGAVMADTDVVFEGKALNLSGEDELVWSDGIADGVITGKWWVGLDDDDYMAGGAGTATSPYEIETAEQLNRVRYGLDKHYVLIDNIDLSGYDNWEPVGSYVPFSEDDEENPDLDYAFTGSLDGNGFTISNLTIDRSDEAGVGLFGCVVGPTKSIEITGMSCSNCANHVGADILEVDGVKFVQIDTVIGGVSTAKVILSQDIENIWADEAGLDAALKEAVEKRKTAGDITSLSVTGPSVSDLIVEDVNVDGSMLVGGVIGYAVYCSLENIILQENNSMNTITGSAMVGGIAGGGFADLIGCDAAADVIVVGDGGSMAGILAGGMEESRLIDCTAVGTITAEGNGVQGIGGLAGCAFKSELVENCSVGNAEITVTGVGNKFIGGLLGMAGTTDGGNPTDILNCTVEDVDIIVTGSSYVGGIVGAGYFMDEDTAAAIVAMLDAMLETNAVSQEEYDSLLEDYSQYFTPSVFYIENCTTSGTVTGGFEFIGAIAGNCDDDAVAADCTSDMTWDGNNNFKNINTPSFAGSGTSDDPYQIENAMQLNKVRYGLDRNYLLTADIDLENKEWQPIGAYVPSEDDDELPVLEAAFTGTFDGGDFTISNIIVDQEDGWGVGLFGCAFESAISHLTVENVSVTGSALVGGVIGYAVECDLDNVILSGDDNTVSGWAMVGGLVGGGFVDFDDCHASANIIVSGDEGQNAGILAGGMEESSFVDCTAEGTITADGDNVHGLGGLAGCAMESMFVENCSANVTINAGGENNQLIGGLLGFSGTSDEGNPTVISGCEAEAYITVDSSASRIGGIIGGGFFRAGYESYHPVPTIYVITDCETTGTIIGSSDAVGSIAGHSYKSTVESCTGSMTDGNDPLPEIGEEQSE